MRQRADYFLYPGTVSPLTVTRHKNPKEIISVIFDVIEMITSINQFEIIKKDRSKKIKEARQLFHYLANKYSKDTLQEIGRLSQRHHSSVIHSVKTVENVLSYNKDLEVKLELMEKEIKRRINLI